MHRLGTESLVRAAFNSISFLRSCSDPGASSPSTPRKADTPSHLGIVVLVDFRSCKFRHYYDSKLNWMYFSSRAALQDQRLLKTAIIANCNFTFQKRWSTGKPIALIPGVELVNRVRHYRVRESQKRGAMIRAKIRTQVKGTAVHTRRFRRRIEDKSEETLVVSREKG